MGKMIDLTGQKFGRLTVIDYAENSKRGAIWNCACDCGNQCRVLCARLRSGHTRSCGCLISEHIGNLNKTYGMSKTKIHYAWGHMKSRCYNPNSQYYKNYGGRGITVCDEWRNDFTAFADWSLANGYADDLTIDRKDNDGNYCPENCRWATAKQQANNKSNNRLFVINGETKTVTQWCECYDIPASLVIGRLYYGWTFEEAIGIIPRKRPYKRAVKDNAISG